MKKYLYSSLDIPLQWTLKRHVFLFNQAGQQRWASRQRIDTLLYTILSIAITLFTVSVTAYADTAGGDKVFANNTALTQDTSQAEDPGDYVVTRTDLDLAMAEMSASMQKEWRALDQQMSSLRAELKGDISELRSEIGALRTELKDDISALRTELKGDIGEVRSELGELKSEVGELKGEVRGIQVGLTIAALIIGGLQLYTIRRKNVPRPS